MIRQEWSGLILLKKWLVGETFAIHKLNWRIPRLALLLLIGYFLLGEFSFRMDSVRSLLTGPRIGSRHRQFEVQIGRLDKLVREGQPIDCIFLGNSMTWLGVNPLVVDQVFQSRSGQEIHCFNFGVSALPASSAGLIAPVLVEKYHPKILVYGTFARDYAIPVDAEDASVVGDTPWLKYQNGDFNLAGWLYDHSSVFQYKGHLRDFLYMNFEEVFIQGDTPDYQAYGLDPKYDIRTDVDMQPDFEAPGNRDPVKWLRDYEIQQENLDGLRQVVHQTNNGVEVVVIEMPFYNTAFEFFSHGESDYEKYIQEVEKITSATHVPFWRLADQPAIPPEYWWDYFHLNLQGANQFSEWLGNHMADAYLQGEVKILSADQR